MRTATYCIRPFCRIDRPAVRRVCGATAWMGSPDPARIGDEWMWAEFWTRYFTDREPGCAWVVVPAAGGEAVGYLTGTCDGRRVQTFLPWLVPGMLWRIVSRGLLRGRTFRRAMSHLLRAVARGEMRLPPAVLRDYPATFHFNLLPQARRQGIGGALFDRFIDRLESLRVTGIHAQTLSVNEPVNLFLASRGFTRVASWPLHAFEHVQPEPIKLHTWIREVILPITQQFGSPRESAQSNTQYTGQVDREISR